MSKAQILTGARAIVYIKDKVVGLFTNCNWSVGQDKQPAYILGRFNPAEITPTSQDPVTLRLTGYRVMDKGPYVVANATALAGLLNENDFTVKIQDRQTGKTIFTAMGCRVRGWSSGVAARGVSDISLDIVGLYGYDESRKDDSDPGAPNLV
jgi:hypothetical protein